MLRESPRSAMSPSSQREASLAGKPAGVSGRCPFLSETGDAWIRVVASSCSQKYTRAWGESQTGRGFWSDMMNERHMAYVHGFQYGRTGNEIWPGS